ncbi:MAG TPA: pentapeptide repeat-containing protein, partial [Alphaproteobacteria bacterium]|nr:pentapeptide repeat-containing protein [Alphaproteobacteria bacterium]
DFNQAEGTGAIFVAAELSYTDFSHAVMTRADFSEANLRQANLHRLDDRDANWTNTNKKLVKETDRHLAIAEDWTPPKPETKTSYE